MTELAVERVRVEAPDRAFLEHLRDRLEAEFEGIERATLEAPAAETTGAEPIVATLVIAFASPLVGRVGEQIGEIIAEEIDTWYRERRAEADAVRVTETKISIDE
ncbi:hypothetical protein [Natrononativus amylolyticus]|uniref:hypothetical protein n=1 Tax=Natrononativus amylolyticus TaxID=2963434 RepID=UPI0020CD7CF2|nr:hypothetical protein [Natrononativus amylolyticus]